MSPRYGLRLGASLHSRAMASPMVSPSVTMVSPWAHLEVVSTPPGAFGGATSLTVDIGKLSEYSSFLPSPSSYLLEEEMQQQCGSTPSFGGAASPGMPTAPPRPPPPPSLLEHCAHAV